MKCSSSNVGNTDGLMGSKY